MKISHRGMMLVLSSPSGAGKTSLSRLLLEQEPSFTMSVSATTRPPRRGEVEGKDYFFVDDAEFERMARNGELLEHATVFGNRYGTPKKAVFDAIEAGGNVLFDIDWQGTQQIAQSAADELVSIFILPPSMQELEQRLIGRGQDGAGVVAKRMKDAPQEISHWAEYDYVIINDDLENALEQIRTIVRAEQLKRYRQPDLVEFVRELTEKT